MTEDEHEDLPYETADPLAYEWTDKAYDMCSGESPLLHARIDTAEGISRAVVHGRCPRCKGHIHWEEPLTASGESGVLGEVGPGQTPDPYSPINVRCTCRRHHRNRPEGVATGCGIGFTIEVWRGEQA